MIKSAEHKYSLERTIFYVDQLISVFYYLKLVQ